MNIFITERRRLVLRDTVRTMLTLRQPGPSRRRYGAAKLRPFSRGQHVNRTALAVLLIEALHGWIDITASLRRIQWAHFSHTPACLKKRLKAYVSSGLFVWVARRLDTVTLLQRIRFGSRLKRHRKRSHPRKPSRSAAAAAVA